MGTTLFIFDPNLSHKLATAKEAARDIFIYSSTANRKSDGTYGAQPSAKAILKPEVKSPSLGLTLSPLLEPMVQTRARVTPWHQPPSGEVAIADWFSMRVASKNNSKNSTSLNNKNLMPL